MEEQTTVRDGFPGGNMLESYDGVRKSQPEGGGAGSIGNASKRRVASWVVPDWPTN